MRSIAFKIISFVLVINLAAGLVNYIAGAGSLERQDGSFSTQGVKYDEKYGDEDYEKIEGEFGTPPVEDSDQAGEQLLDLFSLGIYSRVKGFIDNTLFGIITTLLNIGLIDNVIAGILKWILGLIYLSATLELFTGKSIFG